MKELSLSDVIKLADAIDEKLYGDKSNFDLFKHLQEEIEELKDELYKGEDITPEVRLEQIKEFGDAFFCFASIARKNKIDMLHALCLTITKLQERIKFNISE